MGQAHPKRTVLIVEDDAELRELTAALLEDEQLDTVECESAEENMAIEYRYAEGQYNRLPDMAVDLVRREVTVIVAAPNAPAARAAKAGTSVIPIIFMVADDPVKLGLVASLNRPGGNATGVNYFISELTAKRLGMLRELLPTATRVGALVNPTTTGAEAFTKDVIAAGSTLNIQIEIVHARDSHEIEVAFVTLGRTKIDALMVAPDTLIRH
jgi:putative tryptophan/tyrosine transport system substrate-binding protein